jgi:hypothetical protein
MPGLVPGIHVLVAEQFQDVDGRDKPGHDADMCQSQSLLLQNWHRASALSFDIGFRY